MQASPDDIDLSLVASALKRGLPRIVVVALAVGAMTYGVLLLVPPTYKSTAQIILQSTSSLLRPSSDTANGEVKIDDNEVASQAEVIRSRDLLHTIVAAKQLDQRPEFNPALKSKSLVERLMWVISGLPAGADASERAVTVLEQNLKVNEVPKTRLINIDVSSHDAGLAADLANSIAQAYLDRNRSNQVADASEATDSIRSSITEVKRDAEAAEAELERFRAESGLLSGQNNVSLNSQQLSELNTQLTQATASRTEADARARILRDMIASGKVEDSQEIAKSPNMQQLFQQKLRVERDIAELSATLMPGHPRMRQLASELSIVTDRIREEAKQVAAGMVDDLNVAVARETALRDSIAKLTEMAMKSSDAQAKLGSLEREAQSKRTSYEEMLRRLNEASSRRTNSAVPAMASLNERAVASSLPDSPKKGQMSLFASLATLLLGLVWLIARALMGGKPARGAVRGTLVRPLSAAGTARLADAKAVAQLVANSGRSGVRVLLTGEAPTQDLAKEANAIAAGLGSRQGGIVLIDLSSPPAPTSATAGLAELVMGKATFEEVIRPGVTSPLPRIERGQALDWHRAAETLELVLQALGESYATILVAAQRAEARALLEALDGRLDFGVTCAAPGRASLSPIEDGFLGYEVQDLVVAWMDGASPSPKGSLRRSKPARLNPLAT